MTRARRGMTLMELLVGLTLTGAMAAVGAAAFGSIIDHQRVIRAATVETERAAALRDQLRTWIGSGTPLIQQGGVPRLGGQTASARAAGQMVSSMSGAQVVSAAAALGDELTFVTTAANPAMSPSVRMRLFVDGDGGTPEEGLTIEYQASNQTPLQRRQLEPSVGALTVEFLDQRTNRWRPALEAATIQAIAVRLSLSPLEKGHLPAMLQVPMIFAMPTPANPNVGGR